jgi:hypothetical protein
MRLNDRQLTGGGGTVPEVLYLLCVLGSAILAAFAVLSPKRRDEDEDV